MNEIICPNCHKAFKVDEAGYADILKQVRDHKFEEELQNRLNIAEREKISAVKLAEANIKNEFQNLISNRDKEITELKANNERTLTEQLAKKDNQITELKAKIENSKTEMELSVSLAVQKVEKERDELIHTIKLKGVHPCANPSTPPAAPPCRAARGERWPPAVRPAAAPRPSSRVRR